MEKEIHDGITEENTIAMPTDSESNTDTAVAPAADTSADGNAAGNTANTNADGNAAGNPANTNADGNAASTATVIIDDGDEDEIDPEEDWEDEDEDDDGITLSPAQQLAVDTRDKTLLVSAAAGSGKTFTLSRRILAAITKKDKATGKRLSIDTMLIVTFTRASATDLRRKIGETLRAAIEKQLKKEKKNGALIRHLEKQLYALPSAKICTIDSFCADILRANADRVGISASFRIPDAAECAIIGESILNGIFNEIYAGNLPEIATAEELTSLSECLTNTGGDSDLAKIISDIHLSTVSTVKGVDCFAELIEEYNPAKFTAVENTRFGKYIMDSLHEMGEHFQRALEYCEREVTAYTGTYAKRDELIKKLQTDKGLARSLTKLTTYKEAYTYLPTVYISNSVGNTNKALPNTTSLNNAFKGAVADYIKNFFSHDELEWRYAYTGLYEELGTLLRLLRHYDSELLKEKNRRNICEFHDIERYTYKCMWKDGKRTDVAEAQRLLYSQIYIDEYQDVNELQDEIFRAISTETNRFMVGDIKQSIYRFRGANPDIFARMKMTYPNLEKVKDTDHAAIFMSENYRCDRGVIDFTNLVFDRIFEYIGKNIGYVKEDRLTCSKYSRDPKKEPPSHYPELCLIDSSALAKSYKDDPDWREDMLAPYVVAQKIREVIATERLNQGIKDPETGKVRYNIEPGDIAIIMRTAKGRINLYKRALDEYGIPNAVAEETKFFLTPEALLTLCLLNAIDNPHRDIYLTGLMLSPLYSFTESELALIRRVSPEKNKPSFYTSLKLFIEENPGYKKGINFIESLEKYRTVSEGTATDTLLLRLYHETGLLALAAKNGTKDRLYRLYEYARSYEAGSFKGLYNFISYINSIINRKNSLDKREPINNPDAVKIITAHGSKGLEYPVVFYVGGEDHISGGGGNYSRFEYSEGFGIGMNIRSDTGLALVKNSTRSIISTQAKKKEIEEEARILYVTLTRARERLYIVAPAGKKMEEFEKDVAFSREFLDEYEVYKIGTLYKMLLVGSGIDAKSPAEFLQTVPPQLIEKTTTNVDISPDENGAGSTAKSDTGATVNAKETFIAPTHDTAGEISVPVDESELAKELRRRFGFKYPRMHITLLPGKVSASSLFPRLLDGAGEGETVVSTDEVDGVKSDVTITTGDGKTARRNSSDGERVQRLLRSARLGIQPSFLCEEKKVSATDRGIATHLLFQFCDLDRLKKEGAEAELRHLCDDKFLSDEDAAIVRIGEVEAFRNSRLIDEMIAAEELYREFRFNVLLPADIFATPEAKPLYKDETVLVQGVIDCLYRDADGEYHLIDYKTDRLTREQLGDRDAAKKELSNRHASQLYYYGLAVERIFGKKPATREVYSLHLGDTLSVVTDEFPV